jgi:hypothetical protein
MLLMLPLFYYYYYSHHQHNKIHYYFSYFLLHRSLWQCYLGWATVPLLRKNLHYINCTANHVEKSNEDVRISQVAQPYVTYKFWLLLRVFHEHKFWRVQRKIVLVPKIWCISTKNKLQFILQTIQSLWKGKMNEHIHCQW